MKESNSKSNKRLGLGAKPAGGNYGLEPEFASLKKRLWIKSTPEKTSKKKQKEDNFEDGESRFQFLNRSISEKKAPSNLDFLNNGKLSGKKNKSPKNNESIESTQVKITNGEDFRKQPISDIFSLQMKSNLDTSKELETNLQNPTRPETNLQNPTRPETNLDTRKAPENETYLQTLSKMNPYEDVTHKRRSVKVKYVEKHIEKDGQITKVTERRTKMRSKQKNLKRDNRPAHLKPNYLFKSQA